MNWETDGGRESCERCENNERVCKGEAIFSIHDVDMGGETIPELNTRISTCDRYCSITELPPSFSLLLLASDRIVPSSFFRWKELNGSPDCFSSPLKGTYMTMIWALI